MKTKHLLLTLLLALMVPLAALAQVERTATVYNGTDKECHVPVYGNLNCGDRSLSQFIMDKNVLQTVGLTGKQITKMTFYLANPVPASYQWTTPRYTYVTLAEVDASELDADGNVIDMTDGQIVAHLYLDAQGETMEIAFSSPYTYSGEKNLLVQFEEQYQFYPSGYTPFGPYRKPVFYGVYKDDASGWNKVTYTGGHPTRLNKYNFVPKTTFTYLADEANFFNTRVPQNARATTWCDESNGNYNYKIQLQWDAPANYTGNYQVLCVPRGTSTLDWNNAYSTNNTSYTFEGLQKNTAYDLYVIARQNTSFFSLISAAATASATTPFYPANLDESNLVFDFNSRTMPNGLTLVGNATYLVRPYSDHTYSLNELGYYNVGAGVGSFDWMGRQHYLETSPLTITLPELKFTNASNGLMVEFDLKKEPIYEGEGPAEVLVKLYEHNHDEEVFSTTASTNESYYNGQHFTYRITNVPSSSNQHIFKLSFSSVEGGKGFTIDNIVVRKAPAIIPAYNLAASEITPNSATISWTDDNTNTHTLEVYHRIKGNSAWISPTTVTGTSHTLTGLMPYTDYEVMVKTIVGDNYSNSEILGFSTQCTPALVPYYEPFAGLTTLPTNWRVNVPEYAEVVTEVGNGRLTLHNTATEVTQNIYGYISTYTSYSEFGAYIILPYFNNLGSLQLSFKAGRTQGTMGSLSVGVVADPNNYTDYTEIGTATLTDNANGEVYSYNLVNNAVQSGHIVIYFGKYESNLQSIWLDDFSVQQYAAPTGPVVSNVTNTTATLSWNAGAATEWEVQYKQTTASTWTTVTPNPTSNSCTLTGLTASTDYVAQVSAKYGESSSVWVDFEGFKTYYSAPILVDASHPYSHGFSTMQSTGNGFTTVGDIGGWQLINKGLFGNDWALGTAPGRLNGSLSGLNNYSLYISKDESTYQYIHGETPLIGGGWQGWGTTVYAARVFTLAPGSYQFSYRWKGKGIHESDYFRVALVPANTELTASNSGPTGFSYNSLPTGWIALDGGEALNPMENNVIGFASYTTPESSRINILEEGNYMMVFVWQNDGMKIPSEVNPPIAIDNVGISCTTLITPPEMGNLVAAPTDTQATLTWPVPTCTLTPTGYEVEYATDASFTDALTATANTNSVTLTGLAANTNYYVQIRSLHTANGTTIYSDWSDARAFTTAMPIPTELTLVSQTTSWANVMWTHVALTPPEGQSINYSYQLTTDVNDWGEANEGLGNESWAENLAPGTYHFRVRTAIYDSNANGLVDFSDWSEPIQFTIAPWSEPVSVFPLTYSFDEWSSRFVDGITLDGNLAALEMANYNELLTPDGGENEYSLSFCSSLNTTACVVLPPLNPSTSDAMVSFWWYHHSGHENFPNTGTNDGVEVETSTDGISWTTASYGVVPRYDANFTGWKKYEFVFPATTNPTYLRLRFVGTTGDFLYCYLDDLTVRTFKSEQPYISYVGCDANTATLTIHDNNYQMGWPSSAFEVQYREYREAGETQEEWITYPQFENAEPYTFENTLTVNGLQPATCYEFQVRAYVSYGQNTFPSEYSTIYRQWTDCGTYTITPTYSYTEDFEELFNETDCWTADEGWEMLHEGGHSGNYCAYCPGSVNLQDNAFLTSPAISFSGCNNVILRFWSKGKGIVRVYYGEGFAEHGDIFTLSATEDWEKIELSLSYFMNKGPIKVCFYRKYNNTSAWYVDDVSIIANVYEKVFDCKWNEVGLLTSAGNWYPNGVPSASDEVMIMRGSQVYYSNSPFSCGTINFGTSGSVWVRKNCMLTVTTFNATKRLTVDGTANITTLNAAKANSVVVKDGGVLYAGTITGTSDEVDNTVVVEDGGQLKLDNQAYVTVKKNIGSYTAIEAENNVERGGYYLISSPLNTNYFNPAMAGACTQKTEGGETVWTYDLYAFDYEQELEWRNYKVQNFSMRNGRGYLYANRDGVDLSFAGPVAANNTQMPVSTNYGEGSLYPFNGWTLVGNPYPCNTYISGSASDMSFYRMNPSGSGFMAATGAIKPMEGIFVYTQMAGQAVYFNRDEPTEPGSKLGINLMQGNTLVDNAIIRFGEGGELPKFSFSDNTSKVYIPMADDDYAVVSSQPVGVLPLNFEAAKDGTYTLSFEDATEGLLYCHLIDNKTGADVDLLAGASTGSATYTFSAKADDYASRFKVVFVAKDEDGSSTGSETFAFNNNGNWIIANEGRATLQVIDLNGRILSSEQIEGSVQTSIHQPAGLYLIRLLNGNDVKIQKVIVK